MLKRKKLIVFAMMLVLLLSMNTTLAGATEYVKSTTHSYACNAHDGCSWITFRSHGETSNGTIYDCYFSDNSSHWPNNFRYDNVWSYTVNNWGYAKGSYTLYSSLITQWASIAFSSTSNTIVHVY
ncbi:MAG: hypothetical protein PHW47_03035 [Lachnospira sp.]|jgi:hypothetical protein|nr:hypothetical protein [Lachnospira sp.]